MTSTTHPPACLDCGIAFTFTADERAFHAVRGLTNPPGRCIDCRTIRRLHRSSRGRACDRGSYRSRW